MNLASLRRFKVDIIGLPRGRDLGYMGFSEAWPTDLHIETQIFVANIGATGGILERVEVVAINYTGTSPFSSKLLGSHVIGIELPAAFERDQTVKGILRCPLEAPGTIERFAEQLRGLEEIGLVVKWHYWQPGIFRRRTRTLKSNSHELKTSVDDYRRRITGYWRERHYWEPLAILAPEQVESE